MKTITLYNNLGQVMGTASSSNSDAFSDGTGEYNYIEGQINNEYYIINGNPVYKGQNPSTAEVYYKFDYFSKSWQVDLEQTADSHRNNRNQLIETIDRVNPIRYATLTIDQQQELIAYRQALLDVPQQSGFPEAVEWPAKPTWL